uniref:Uncharacterized protein n=1 Tax=Tetradesmus obliquus TaxID=3088 RepID=A0A383WMF3_TETOB|eukprot:jgi/Sobl393_1/1665/SZX78625.1
MKAPDSGFECGCTDGYVLVNGVCQDEDGCAGDPCDLTSNPGNMCTDALAPNNGSYCGCKPTYYADRDNKCQEKLACELADSSLSGCANQDNWNGVCTKYPSTVPDIYIYECGCNRGYRWNPFLQKCQENPGCDRVVNPCTNVANSDATCTDVFNSFSWELQYKCACNAGYLWNPRASGSDSGTCKENPGGCNPAQNPCAGVANSNGGCTDVAAQTGMFGSPLLAYQCACNAGYVWFITETIDGNTGSIAVGSCRRDA